MTTPFGYELPLVKPRPFVGEPAEKPESAPEPQDDSSSVDVQETPPEPAEEPTAASPDAEAAFNPDNHTVDEVVAYVEKHPDELERILIAEAAGQARKGIAALADDD